VFVPGGWWHAVLNLDDTIAITQNYCSSANFEAVWRKTRSGRKKMAVKWLRKLHATNPRLAASAERLNTEDGFQMYDKKANKSVSE
jgi:histone arginine demethylase JMJD6